MVARSLMYKAAQAKAECSLLSGSDKLGCFYQYQDAPRQRFSTSHIDPQPDVQQSSEDKFLLIMTL